ncbi:MAG: helix-turn-helix transcriptional regulator [Lachnospiraceae bacterium]|nr:helix-turn-helix transcriptional regulator [Lachnospiraceae bacterium]
MVGKNIARLRKEAGMTQEELAEKLSVTRQAVSGWERERTEPDLDMVQKAAQSDVE